MFTAVSEVDISTIGRAFPIGRLWACVKLCDLTLVVRVSDWLTVLVNMGRVTALSVCRSAAELLCSC